MNEESLRECAEIGGIYKIGYGYTTCIVKVTGESDEKGNFPIEMLDCYGKELERFKDRTYKNGVLMVTRISKAYGTELWKALNEV